MYFGFMQLNVVNLFVYWECKSPERDKGCAETNDRTSVSCSKLEYVKVHCV